MGDGRDGTAAARPGRGIPQLYLQLHEAMAGVLRDHLRNSFDSQLPGQASTCTGSSAGSGAGKTLQQLELENGEFDERVAILEVRLEELKAAMGRDEADLVAWQQELLWLDAAKVCAEA